MQKQEQNAAAEIRVINLQTTDTCQSAVAAIGDQNTPVVLVFPDHPFQTAWRPDDFRRFTLIRRQRNMQILLVIPLDGSLRRWAHAHGFKDVTFPSLEAIEERLIGKNGAVGSGPGQRSDEGTSPPLPALDGTPVPFGTLLTSEEQQPTFSTLAPTTTVLQPASGGANSHVPNTPGKPPPLRRRRRRWLLISLTTVALIIIMASFAALLFTEHPTTGASPSPAPSLGNIYFLCSGQFNQSNTAGCNDIVALHLFHLSPPAVGMSYYAWLLGDARTGLVASLYLGKLSPTRGSATLTYTDPHHTNLLATFSRVLVTQQDGSVLPSTYSLERSDWRSYGEISAMPNPNDTVHHYSLVDHVRHLLAEDPELVSVGLHGGLDIWFFRNTEKLTEWTSAASGYSNAPDFLHRMLVRILAYLDGSTVVQQDLPQETDIGALVDLTQARVGLLVVNPATDEPPGYIYHIGVHLASLVTSPGVTPGQVALANQITTALSYVKQWLEQTRNDALQLIKLTGGQLRQPSAQTLLNDMNTAARNAFDGTPPDPITGQGEKGSYWIHNAMQGLATLDMTMDTNQ